MPCDIHNWWFDTPCPQCALAATVTEPAPAPVPDPSTPPYNVELSETVVEPLPEELVPLPESDLEFPEFLRRNPDNTFAHPKPWSELKPLQQVVEAPPAEDVRGLSDAELHERLYSDMPVAHRQVFLREAVRRENKTKTFERLDKAGFLKPKDKDPQLE